MHPHLKVAYDIGADAAKFEFEKEGFTLIEALIAGGALGAGGAGVHALGRHGREKLIQGGNETAGRVVGGVGQGLGGAMGGTAAGSLLGTLAGAALKRPGLGLALGAGGGALVGGNLGAMAGARPKDERDEPAAKEGQMAEAAPLPSELAQGQPPEAMEAAPPEAGAAPNLGDPNFWGGGTPPGGAEGAGAGASSAEEAVSLLPAGSFQGLNTRVTPEGERSTGVKVSPLALDAPDALKTMFQAEPGVRVEITEPETPSSVTSFREGR